ncbi:nudC domain-containing protein 2-like isoform X2 [Dreissena polymorpha]|uniref:nudC domain-containing protein 2-like isoform X2 n=1 Tax=Dreissena polymorpha TaxID=45954 RepID=UPI002264DA89|nr:nudC domain-containing protein 2-like isoform X2 [Dreissena polymorpha]
MSHFDESSGIVACRTEWGQWWQTMEEVYVEVNLEEGTTAKMVKCAVTNKTLSVTVKDKIIIKGDLTSIIKAEDSVWTIEDKKLLRLCLPKAKTTADQCWVSLLKGQFGADHWTLDQMQKKLTLQRYQFETEAVFEGCP